MFNFITNFFNKNQEQTDQFLNKDQKVKYLIFKEESKNPKKSKSKKK